jgi:integrase
MQGSLRQRGAASWELRVYAGTNPDTGKRRYRTATVTGNRADAERGLVCLVAEVHSDKSIGSASTVSELLEAWFAIASTSWAPTTIRETRSILDCCLHPHLGMLRVGEVTPAVIDATYVVLRERGSMKGGPLKPGTLSRIHVVLRSAFSQAQRWGWVWDNPAERAHRIVVPPTEMQPPTPAELQLLLDYIGQRDRPFHALVLLAATTGARRAQLLGLQWEQFHRDTMRVEFCRGWVDGHNGPTVAPTKTRRRHSVDISKLTFDAVMSLGDERATGFVFSDDGGATAWKPNRVTKTFIRYRRAAGCREFRFHDLRHFMATEMLNAGIPLPVVARRLDHQRASTTLNFYAQAVPGGDAHAARTLESLLTTHASR